MLHPAVYNVARPLWDKGNYRHAVADAATNVSNLAQRTLKRYDVSDRALMAEAFSDKDPERGKSRLRYPGKRNSETVKSMQEGAKLFAMGTFHTVRNPAHHSIGDGEPVAAFEDLAALSKVARWIEDWYVDVYLEPIEVTQLAPTSGTLPESLNVSASLSGARRSLPADPRNLVLVHLPRRPLSGLRFRGPHPGRPRPGDGP